MESHSSRVRGLKYTFKDDEKDAALFLSLKIYKYLKIKEYKNM
jgi:hypothetical protein